MYSVLLIQLKLINKVFYLNYQTSLLKNRKDEFKALFINI